MSVTCVKSDNADELVYRQGRRYGWPIGFGLLALAVLLSTVAGMVRDWPTGAWSYAQGAFVCAIVFVWAIGKSASYVLVLDRRACQARVSVRRLWRTTNEAFEISAATEVLYCVSQLIETPDSHWVALRTSDGKESRLFDGPPYMQMGADEASAIAAEIGMHLNVPVVSVINGVDAARDDSSMPTL